MIHFYFALPHVTLEMQCVVLLVPCIYSPCRWTSQCKKRRNTLMCLVGSTTFSITLVSDSICPMSSLSRTDVGEVYSRLLDHRPVIQGEIRYFVKEFEEKRGLRELRVLENLKNTIFETNERVLPKCEQAMQDNLSETFKRLQAANAMMHRLQEREYEARKMGSPVAIEYWYWANSTRLSTDRVCFVSNTRVDTQRASGRQGDGS
uniref:Biogenesis of lysosome-related organelles complex 1 subunit 5 n=1 Tax=Ficedula albicollis TaxID=59894 RepID=A0A803VRG1_FICAL